MGCPCAADSDVKKVIYVFAGFVAAGVLVVLGILLWFNAQLPPLDTLKAYEPALITKVFDRHGELITEYAAERREIVELTEMPPHLLDAFVAAEDDKFYRHFGIDPIGIMRAVWKALMAGEIRQGASTITQQVARSFFLSQKREISRKIKEILLAFKLELNLSKDEILFLYLNQIYLGRGAYGVGSAAEVYFGVKPAELTVAQASMIAGLPPAPSRYAPHIAPDKARTRQLYVLNRMLETGRLSAEAAEAARNERVGIVEWIAPSWNAPWVDSFVRQWLFERFPEDAVLSGGLRVYTTFDLGATRRAEQALRTGLEDLDKRQGYRGPITAVAQTEWSALTERFALAVSEKVERRTQGRVIDWIGPAATSAAAPLPVTAILQPEDLFAGLVTGFDRKNKLAWVDFGLGVGRLAAEGMAWAREPDPDFYPTTSILVADPAARLKRGSHILVRKYAPAYIDRLDLNETARKNVKDRLDTMAADGGPLVMLLEQTPLVQGAIVSILPQSGEVIAMVGGYDFSASQFNRAVQAKRQPGSAFKPVVYSAALDAGLTPASILIDSPVVYQDVEREFRWKPKNYENKFYGPMTLVDALTYSRNLVTIQLVRDIGIDRIRDRAVALGIETELPRDLSMALGSGVVTPLEMTLPYATFANLGRRPQAVFVREVWDATGNSVYSYLPPTTDRVAIRFSPFEKAPLQGKRDVPFGLRAVGAVYADAPTAYPQAISPETAYQMTYLLRNVVERGTGWRSRAIGQPAAGKTGTTDDNIDSWFSGYTCDVATSVWVGFDQLQPLGRIETGSRAANPIWVDFMKEIKKNQPICEFAIPDGIVFRDIDAETGRPAQPWTSNKVLLMPFRKDQVGGLAERIRGDSEGAHDFMQKPGEW